MIKIHNYFANQPFDFVISTSMYYIKNLLAFSILKKNGNAIIYLQNIFDSNNIKLTNENKKLKKQVENANFYYYFAIACSLFIGISNMIKYRQSDDR